MATLASPQDRLVSGDGRMPTVRQLLRKHGIALSKEGLLKALKHNNPEVRYLAAQQLAEENETDAIPAMTAALRSERNLRARTNIAYALAQMGARRGFSTLKAICHNRTIPSYERLLAVDYLLRMGDESCNKVVLDYLRPRADPSAQVGAMYLLRRMSGISMDERLRALNFVHDSLSVRDISVKLTASDTLVSLKDETAIPAFERAIASETNREVRSKMQSDLKRLSAQRDKP
jgi:HEAT repeat protein